MTITIEKFRLEDDRRVELIFRYGEDVHNPNYDVYVDGELIFGTKPLRHDFDPKLHSERAKDREKRYFESAPKANAA